MQQVFSHLAITVPRELLTGAPREQLLAFYEEVFGWTENPALAIVGERIFLRAPTDRQYLTVRASDQPMRTSGYEHLGLAVASSADLEELHGRARFWVERDPRVKLGNVEIGYGGRLHSFRVQYLLPVTIEVQYLTG